MNVHAVFKLIFKFTRKPRMLRFERAFDTKISHTILDIGGSTGNWEYISSLPSVTLLNINFVPDEESDNRFQFIEGDARQLQFPDKSFDIAFSNSVIEHVGTFKDQRLFAQEAQRVSNNVWIQTPAKEFFFEPHYLTPFIHWVPIELRRKIVRYTTVWGYLTKPSQKVIDERIQEIRLLNRAEMKELFPDCEILVERFLGMPKSYVAFRKEL